MIVPVLLCQCLSVAGTVGPPPPAGASEGDFVEVAGVPYEVHGGKLYTLDDPALADAHLTVTVTGSRADKKRKVVRTDAITSAEIEESGARTLADVLEKQAGIQVNDSFGLGQEVALDGLGGREVLVLVDGRPVNSRINNHTDVSRIPVSASTIERIEIVRGPMSALYGSEALGGVINIITKKPSATPGGEVELGGQLVDAGPRGLFGGSIGGVGLWSTLGVHGHGGRGPVAARVDVSGSSLPGTDRGGDGKLDVPDRRQMSAHADVAVPLVPIGFLDDVVFRTQVDGSVSQSLTPAPAAFSERDRTAEWSAAAVVEGDMPAPVSVGDLALDLRIDRAGHAFDKLPGGAAHLAPSFCREGGLAFDPPCPAHPVRNTNELEDEARLELRLTEPVLESAPFADELTIAAGAVVARQELARTDKNGDDALPGGSERDTLSMYGEALWRPLPWLSLTPGGRFDVTLPAPPSASAVLVPKIGARADGPFGVSLRLEYGRGFRFPSFEERFLRFDHSELGYVVSGNPDLRPERSHGFRGEALWEPGDDVSLGVEGYLNIVDDLIDFDVGAPTDDPTVSAFTYVNRPHAYTSGVNVRASLGPFFGFRFEGSYQYLINAVDSSACPRTNPYFCGGDEGARSLLLRPAHQLDATLRYAIASTQLFARADGISERFVDDAGTVSPGHVQLSVGVRQALFDHAEVTLSVDDLNDAYDATYGPKPGRHVSIGLRVWN